MAYTIGESIVPTPVVDVLNDLITAASPFLGTGVAVMEPASERSLGGNNYMRRYDAEDTNHGVTITGSALTPQLLGAHRDVGPVLRRARFRRIIDGSAEAEGGLLSASPDDRIVRSTARYWQAELDLALLAVLEAAFAETGPLFATHLSDVSTPTGAGVNLSFANAVEAANLIGDRAGELAVAVVHSDVAKNLYLALGERLVTVPVGPVPVAPAGVYLGNLKVVVSDRCPVGGTVDRPTYKSFLLATGALWMTEQAGLKEIAAPNPSVAGWDVTQTAHVALGLSGLASTSAMGEAPTNETLATPTNWELSIAPMTDASRKSIRCVCIVTNG